MANTKIQIKRSSATATPTNGSLSAGEFAYSYNSERLFLGTANSANVQEVGGTYWINHTIAAFDKANNASAQGMDYPFVNTAANSANSYAVTIGAASNTWANTIAQNWANTRLANVVATSGRTVVTWSTTNGYTNATLDLATTAVSPSTYGGATQIPVFTVDSYGRLTFAANVAVQGMDYAFANGVANSANAYAVTVGAAGNTYAMVYANGIGNSVNSYTTATYVKLTATNQTITGDLAITGNLVLLGNATTITSNNLIVGDSLIYLAANNYTGTDILDIGFVANYGNATAANVHTGLIRDATTKQYYLFQGYDAELQGNNQTFTMGANNSTFAALNADLVTSNLNLGGANAITWINSLYPYSNGTANAANAYALTIGASSNGWANTLSTADRAVANAAANSANAYTVTVGAASNTWANTIAQNWANTRLANVIATAGRTVVTWSTTNGYTNATLDLATTAVSAATYGGSDQIASFTVDAYGRLTFAGNNGINVGAATAGTLPVARGGTGNTTFTANSVLIGAGANAIWGLSSSTEGHVLQVSAAGAPQFAMLDGGSF